MRRALGKCSAREATRGAAMPSEALKALTQRVAELEAAFRGPEGALALLAGRVDGLEKRLVAERIKTVQEQETSKAQAKTEQLKKEILRTREVQDAQRSKELAVISQQATGDRTW